MEMFVVSLFTIVEINAMANFGPGNHDFPRLAKESGYYFQLHRGRVNWSDIATVNIEDMIEGRDFESLERNLINVVNCNLDREYDVKILDGNFVKLFKLAQLGVDYLSYCEKYLDRCVMVLRKQLTESQQKCIKLKDKLKKKEGDIKKTRKPKDSEAGCQCAPCDRIFMSESYLLAHQKRRHWSPAHTSVSQNKEQEIARFTEKSQQTEIATHAREVNSSTIETQTEMTQLETQTVKTSQSQEHNSNLNMLKSQEHNSNLDMLKLELERLKERLTTTEQQFQDKHLNVGQQNYMSPYFPLGHLPFSFPWYPQHVGYVDQAPVDINSRRDQIPTQMSLNAQSSNIQTPTAVSIPQPSAVETSKALNDVSVYHSIVQTSPRPAQETPKSSGMTPSSTESLVLQTTSAVVETIEPGILNQTLATTTRTMSRDLSSAQKTGEANMSDLSSAQKTVPATSTRRTHSTISVQIPQVKPTSLIPAQTETTNLDDDLVVEEIVPVPFPRKPKKMFQESVPTMMEPLDLDDDVNLDKPDLSAESFSVENSPLENENQPRWLTNKTNKSLERLKLKTESSVFKQLARASASPKQGLQRVRRSLKKSWTNLYDTIAGSRDSVKDVQSDSFQEKDKEESKVVEGVNLRLRELGVNPDWQGIPQQTFNQTMEILQHKRKQLAKDHPAYTSVRKELDNRVMMKLQDEQLAASGGNREMTILKDGSLEVGTGEGKQWTSNESLDSREISQVIEDVHSQLGRPETEKDKSSIMYDISSESDSDMSQSAITVRPPPTRFLSTHTFPEKITQVEPSTLKKDSKEKQFDISVFQVGAKAGPTKQMDTIDLVGAKAGPTKQMDTLDQILTDSDFEDEFLKEFAENSMKSISGLLNTKVEVAGEGGNKTKGAESEEKPRSDGNQSILKRSRVMNSTHKPKKVIFADEEQALRQTEDDWSSDNEWGI